MSRKMVLLAGGVAAILAMLVFATGCGGGGATKVQVEESEWKIVPQPASVNAGKIEFSVKNTGKEDHEMVVIRTDKAPDALPVTNGKVDEDKPGDTTGEGEVEDVGAGETKSGTLDLKPGKYVLICNIAGHYQQGMRVAFEVK